MQRAISSSRGLGLSAIGLSRSAGHGLRANRQGARQRGPKEGLGLVVATCLGNVIAAKAAKIAGLLPLCASSGGDTIG